MMIAEMFKLFQIYIVIYTYIGGKIMKLIKTFVSAILSLSLGSFSAKASECGRFKLLK